MPTTTQSTVGTASRTYTTIDLWEAAKPADLTASGGVVWEGLLYREGAGTNGEWTLPTQFSIGGSTTSSTCFARLRAAPGQSWGEAAVPVGRYDASKGVAIRATGIYGNATPFVVSERYTQFVGLQFMTNGGTQFKGYDDLVFDSCVLQLGTLTAGTAVLGNNGGSNIQLTNSLVLGKMALSSSAIIGIYALNSTFLGDATDTLVTSVYGGKISFVNCAIGGYTAQGTGVDSGSSNNVTDLVSMTGTSNTTSQTLANIFVNPAFIATDMRIKTGSPAINAGTTVGAPTVDAFGQARIGNPDAGMHELAVAAAQILRPFNFAPQLAM